MRMSYKGKRTILFAASRWPEHTTFPQGYLTDLEIVLASMDDLDKPFVFEKVIIWRRKGEYWDSMMAHNPYVIRADEKKEKYKGMRRGKEKAELVDVKDNRKGGNAFQGICPRHISIRR